MEIKVCIIGCGDRGRAHAEVWAQHPNVRVVAVSDTDTERATALAAVTGATEYDDWREAIKHHSVSIISQCVPSSLHADITCFAAEHGRHVFGEKPLALTLKEGERIASCIRDTGVVFMPCFQYRDRWLYRKYRNAFQRQVLGTPLVFRHTGISEIRPKIAMHRSSMNGGPVIDLACHYFDLFRWITDAEPHSVYAGGNVFGRSKPPLESIDDLAVDTASIEVDYSDGHQLQLFISWGMPRGFSSLSEDHMVGPNGLIRQIDNGLEERIGNKTRQINETENSESDLMVRTKQFIHAVERNEPPDITCDDALTALKVSHAALRSIASGAVEKI